MGAETMNRAALRHDWRKLCTEIGERRAGTAGERAAADYIAQSWHAAGLTNVHLEPFACTSMQKLMATVSAPTADGWQPVPAAALVGTPATPGTEPIEAPLAWIHLPESAHRLQRRSLRGKILALFGPLPTDAATHRRLVAAEPIAVIHVDERLPFTWTKQDGMYPYWVRRYGVRPTLTVPYRVAWQWRQHDVARLRVQVIAEGVRGESQNVVGEVTGRKPELPALLLSAHHDTQCGNTGADDNASGVVGLLALARALGEQRRPTRTIRFVSFGTEEQLSVGAAVYARMHRVSRRDIALVINYDSVASPLGHYLMWIAGPAALEETARRRLQAGGVDVLARREVSPFFDHFPFNRAGIPSLTFMRENFPGGRWQHHSPHDNLENVSPDVLHRLLAACLPLITSLAAKPRLPFRAALPADQQAVARKLGRDLLGA